MKIPARYIVAGVLLMFAWKGADVSLEWPLPGLDNVAAPQPDPAILAWAEPLKPILPKMLPADRKYLANFYDACAYIVLHDGDRDVPIIGTTDQFVIFHSGSLRTAIEKAKVGRYPGLGEAIDQTFVNAMGADPKKLDAASRSRLVAACGVLSWAFRIGHE